MRGDPVRPGVWFHSTINDPFFKSGPFIPPQPPATKTQELKAELKALGSELAQYRIVHHETIQQLDAMEAQLIQPRTSIRFKKTWSKKPRRKSRSQAHTYLSRLTVNHPTVVRADLFDAESKPTGWITAEHFRGRYKHDKKAPAPETNGRGCYPFIHERKIYSCGAIWRICKRSP